MRLTDETKLAIACDTIVNDIVQIRKCEDVVITSDAASDPRVAAQLFNAARIAKANVMTATIPQMPFQGRLADPFIPKPLATALHECDVWLDTTFPYMAGSTPHGSVVKAGRARVFGLSDLGAEGVSRIFGTIDLDVIHTLQEALDDLMIASAGKRCRVTTPLGTDVSFNLGRSTRKKPRHITEPGAYSVPASVVIQPDPDTVQGVIVIEAAFHEYFTRLAMPIRIEVDGQIRDVKGDPAELLTFKRSLQRAAGQSNGLGKIIHFSHGFHPKARMTGSSFVEDIRVVGADAIGFGTPWWEPGGGENHPDGMVASHSFWIEGEQVVKDGLVVYPGAAQAAQAALQAAAV